MKSHTSSAFQRQPRTNSTRYKNSSSPTTMSIYGWVCSVHHIYIYSSFSKIHIFMYSFFYQANCQVVWPRPITRHYAAVLVFLVSRDARRWRWPPSSTCDVSGSLGMTHPEAEPCNAIPNSNVMSNRRQRFYWMGVYELHVSRQVCGIKERLDHADYRLKKNPL